MKTYHSLIALILFTFFSCIKYEPGYSAKGTVTHASTGLPAQGVPVYLILSTQDAKGQSSYRTEKVSTTYTDSQGSYIIYYKKLRGWKYSYTVFIDGLGLYQDNMGMRGATLYHKNSIVDYAIRN